MKTQKKKKEMTIEDLAKIMQQGFSDADVKTDKKIEKLAVMVQNGFLEMDSKFSKLFNVLADSQELMKGDIRDIKTTLGPLVMISGMQDREVSDLKTRVARLERKAGVR
jgi:hypothetical protein